MVSKASPVSACCPSTSGLAMPPILLVLRSDKAVRHACEVVGDGPRHALFRQRGSTTCWEQRGVRCPAGKQRGDHRGGFLVVLRDLFAVVEIRRQVRLRLAPHLLHL